MKVKICFLIILSIIICLFYKLQAKEIKTINNKSDIYMKTYYFPSEEKKHEGTWLNWPHQYTHGKKYLDEIEGIWIETVNALHNDENVHIVAYDEIEKKRITKLFLDNKINMNKIDFVIAKTDDVWSRDTGPIFVYDNNNELVIVDFVFDGWGKKTPYKNDDKIPEAVAVKKNITIISIPDFVLEGGSIELDGNGTAMLCKSSVVSKNRNEAMTVAEAEKYISKYFGVVNFIWLDGVTDEDITDAHIDGTARFYDENTILTVSEDDFFNMYEGMPESDYDTLTSALNANNKPYKIIEFPMTSKNVGKLKYKGSYLNYYVGNSVVLMPSYNDVNDKIAEEILSKLYKDRNIVAIDVSKLYKYGGMIHCITQQQPIIK